MGLLATGVNLLKTHKIEQGVQVLQTYVAGEKENWLGQVSLAKGYLMRSWPGDVEKAVVHARIGVQNASPQEQGKAFLILGLSLMSLERIESDSQIKRSLRQEAIKALSLASSFDKLSIACCYHLSLLQAQDMEFQSALEQVAKAMEISQGEHIKSWGLMANILVARNKVPKALKFLEKEIDQLGKDITDDKVLLMRLRGRILQQSNRGREAVELLESVTDLFDEQATNTTLQTKLDVHHDLCMMYLQQDKIFDAEQWANKANELCENCSRVYLMRGAVFSAIGQLEKAMGQWEAALAIEPRNVEASVKLGEAHMKLGGRSHLMYAQELLQEAIRRRSDCREAWYCLGQVQSQMGMGKQAEHSLRQAVLLGENEPALSFALFPMDLEINQYQQELSA
eukprot:TRINITY_DN12735_c0_g1_i15.p1 TRINITY_DN12735_c0_g1~~TRINITY_DN12735_c0_g1_i15.p1  ORF type:complete len:397 (+),score=58.31 TRINITY_DN12735_c0_g1_i15:187-1377(+)